MPGSRGSTHKRRRTFLREWRLYREMTLEQVGKMIHRDHSSLGRLETGHSAYTQHTLEQLADVYRCTTADLLGRDPHAQDNIPGEIAAMVTRADCDTQKQARAIVSALLKK